MSDIENQQRGRYNSSSFSIISEDAVYRGDVEFEGVLHINGDFYGKIQGNGDLGVGLTGRVRSVIRVNNAVISGLVCGDLFAQGRVGIKSSAIVVGDIRASSLVVEEGSILHGKLEVLDSEKQRKITKPALSAYRKNKTGESSPAIGSALKSSQKSDKQPATQNQKTPHSNNNAAAESPESDKSAKTGATEAEQETPRKSKYSVWN